jgi:two-component system cell cycle response regulator DivK
MARILLVEDNPQNLKLTTVILTAAGHEVIPARDATEAEQALGARTPELILMDLALPGKDGYTLTREIRQCPETAHLPILAVSSFAMPGDAERALAVGCSGYLTKPIRRAVLLERVEALLRPRAAAPAPESARAADGPRANPADPAREPTTSAAESPASSSTPASTGMDPPSPPPANGPGGPG